MLMGCFISGSSFAQTTTKAVEMNQGNMMNNGDTLNHNKMMNHGNMMNNNDTLSHGKMMNNDYYMMKAGKMMMVMKDGKEMPMNKDITMNNGTKCMTNGEYVTKDGKKMKMKEGDRIDMNGNMSHGEMMNRGKK